MTQEYSTERVFKNLNYNLVQEIRKTAVIKQFPRNTELVKEGQNVKYLPVMLNGLIRVYTQFEDKEFLLYYIRPEQSCIMSFSSCLNNEVSRIYAVTEVESSVLLIPSDRIPKWVIEHPTINLLFFRQYDLRYFGLIDSINHLLHHKLNKRIFDFLAEKVKLTGKNPIRISHKEIANELGTVREVVSRLIKKLENQNMLKQHIDSIEIFSLK